jgi:hypothetical protein
VKKEATFNFDVSREGIEARLDEMGQKLERLRGLYESFFMGIERSPPDVLRRELNRQILEMQQLPINNASLRFRYHALTQRWVLLITYWNRTLREIEAGTFSRDLAKAKRRMAQKGTSTVTLAEALAMGIPANRAKAFVAHQQAAQERNAAATRARDGATSATPAPLTEPPALAEAAGAKPAPPAPQVTSGPSGEPPPIPLPGLSEAEMQDVYRRYLEAHQKAGKTEPAPSMSKLRERLAKQLPQILSANNCSRVRLDIAAENGKVRLRAWPVTEK